MCGRFTLTLDPEELREALKLGDMPPQWIPRYNVAPSQPVAAVTDAQTRAVDFLRWGLVPSWAKDISIGSRLINARAETLEEKPSFRTALQRRRCLILADGFYEWAKSRSTKGSSMPFYFSLQSGQPFMFAGLWEIWRSSEDDVLRSCTIITTEANEVVAPVHERMPVILTGDDAWRWLNPGPAATVKGLLKPYPAEAMRAYPVGKDVNSPNIDQSHLIEPATLF
jgi:putative SOS response-associated peptidase YedK